MSDLNEVEFETASEGTPTSVDLEEFAEEPGGAWPKGWYHATIIEGYQTSKGFQFVTGDEPSKDGNSRNLRICYAISNGDQSRNTQETYNYRVADFTAERLAFVKEAREEFKGVRGRWANGDAQRSSLAIAKLGGLGKGIQSKGGLLLTPQGTLNPAQFIGKDLDVYLGVDDNGFNEVRNVAPAGERSPLRKVSQPS